jgi:hypothetical protein
VLIWVSLGSIRLGRLLTLTAQGLPIVDDEQAMWIVVFVDMVQNGFVEIDLGFLLVGNGMHAALVTEHIRKYVLQPLNLYTRLGT